MIYSRPFRAIVFAAVLVLGSSTRPARADTSIGDGGAWLLWLGSAIVTGANLISITLTDGSEGLGVAGVVIGGTLATYSLIDDDVQAESDSGFFVGSGVATALVGAANFFISRKKDPEVFGLRLEPSISPDRVPGLQLSYNW
jgi:hypothetical protein